MEHLTGRKQLKRERAEFEREKAFYEGERRRQQKEWKNIKQGLGRTFQGTGTMGAVKKQGIRKESTKREYKGYEQSRAENRGQARKERTGRYFERFAKFDLDNFIK